MSIIKEGGLTSFNDLGAYSLTSNFGPGDVLALGKVFTKCYKVCKGAEGDIVIIITNRLDKVIDIQLTSNDKDKKYDRTELKKDQSSIENLSSQAGITHTTKLQCQFWIGQMNFTVQVYGGHAGREKEMKYEVREKGERCLLVE